MAPVEEEKRQGEAEMGYCRCHFQGTDDSYRCGNCPGRGGTQHPAELSPEAKDLLAEVQVAIGEATMLAGNWADRNSDADEISGHLAVIREFLDYAIPFIRNLPALQQAREEREAELLERVESIFSGVCMCNYLTAAEQDTAISVAREMKEAVESSLCSAAPPPPTTTEET